MKKIKGIILIFIIIIIILIISLIFLRNSSKKNADNDINSDDPFQINVNNDISQVMEDSQFFFIENCVNNYYNYLHNGNKEAVDSILDSNYKKENQITLENNIEKLNIENEKYFYANKIEVKEIDVDINEYFISGKIYDEKYQFIRETNYTVVENETLYSIIPEDRRNKTDILNTNLKQNDKLYNVIGVKYFLDEDIIKKYFEYFKAMSINNPEIAFSLIDENYKTQKFNNSIENFKEFINQINIKESTLQKYKIKQLENSSEYIGIDANGNYYVFDVKSPMNFTVKFSM